MMERFRATALLLALLAGACTQPTEIVVSFDSDLFIPEEMTTIGLEVAYTDVTPITVSVSKTWEVDLNVPNAVDLPATIGLLPGEAQKRPIEITVSGYRDGDLVLNRKARLTFVSERILLLAMNLLRSCMYVKCPPGQTCTENGCTPIDIDPNDLPEYKPGKIVTVGDTLTEPPDLGVPDAPPPDVMLPDLPPPDGAVPDAGLPDLPPPDLGVPDLMLPDACQPPSGWWNPAYARRRQLTVTETAAGSLPAGYSVRVVVDTQALVGSGALLASGDDLRVVRAGQELDRRLIGLGTASTEVWFKTQAPITGSDTSYALYFDNPAAGAPPAHWADSMGADAVPSGVYLAADDFEDDTVGAAPDGWVGSTSYTVELDGSNKTLGVNGSSPDADYLFAGDLSWTDVAVRARLRVLDTTGDHYGLFARADSATNMDALWFGLATNSSLQVYTCVVSSPSANSLVGSLKNTWGIPAAGTSWHELEIRAVGADSSYYYDGVKQGDYTIVGTQMQQGRIGLCAGYPASHARWDDMIVRMYVEPEPAVAAAAAEHPCP